MLFEEPLDKPTSVDMSAFLDSTSRNYFSKLWAKLSSKKTPVERYSLHRQHESARQSLMGKIPRDYTLLFHRGPVPAPTINKQQYFANLDELRKSYDLSEEYFKSPFGVYPDMKNKESRVSMKYSSLLYSYPWPRDFSLQLSEGNTVSWTKPGRGENGADQDIEALRGHRSSLEKSSAQHKKHSISVISRPGSNTKPTLPPIPKGRR